MANAAAAERTHRRLYFFFTPFGVLLFHIFFCSFSCDELKSGFVNLI